MTRNKAFLRWLRKQIKALPEEIYTAYHKEIDSSPLGKGKIVAFSPEECPVNHFRRCKRLFKKQGLLAVEQYFKDRGFLIMNAKESI